MKQFLTSIVLSGILLTSCTISIVNQRKPYADDKLKLGKIIHSQFKMIKSIIWKFPK